MSAKIAGRHKYFVASSFKSFKTTWVYSPSRSLRPRSQISSVNQSAQSMFSPLSLCTKGRAPFSPACTLLKKSSIFLRVGILLSFSARDERFFVHL